MLKRRTWLAVLLAWMLVVTISAGGVSALVLPTESETEATDASQALDTLLDNVYEALDAWSPDLVIGEFDAPNILSLVIFVLEPQDHEKPFDYDGFNDAVFSMFEQTWFQYTRVHLDFIDKDGLRYQMNEFDLLTGDWHQQEFASGDVEPGAGFTEFSLEEKVKLDDIAFTVTG